eukprot:2070962-Prymnesium_polylepis.2
MAKSYFDCHDNASWAGLPLMGKPEQGRASHWETRIMRDDVMSYGNQATVSSITLAAMEDLGFYIANYSAAQCLHWGYQQGCDYVRSRCGQMREVKHASTGQARKRGDCRGDPFWATHPDEMLAKKCARGNDPCTVTGTPIAACDPQAT